MISYQVLAKFYDLFDLLFLLDGKGNPRRGLVETIGDMPQSILDVCVGTAASSLVIASHNTQNCIVGIDISAGMLEVARRKITRKKLTNLEVQNMSATAMQFTDASFDAVMVSFALHEFEPGLREQVFQEVTRVLKPGGKFCVIDFARQPGRRNRLFLNVWRRFEPACFTGFLETNWRAGLNDGKLVYESEKAYAFSNLYVLRKV